MLKIIPSTAEGIHKRFIIKPKKADQITLFTPRFSIPHVRKAKKGYDRHDRRNS